MVSRCRYKWLKQFGAALFLLLHQTAFTQLFSGLYYDNRPLMIFGSIEEYNGNYYTIGTTAANTTPHYLKGSFGKITEDGITIQFQTLIDTLPYSYQLYSNNLKQTEDGNFIATGEMIDTMKKVFIAKLDTTGKILLWVQLADTNLNIFQSKDILEIKDKGYLLAINAGFTNGNSEVMIIRTDTLGNVISKKVHGAGLLEVPWTIRATLNGNYLVGAASLPVGGNTPYYVKTWLVEVDSMGNKLNEWLDTDKRNLWPRSMQQTADSGWIIVRQHVAYDVNDVQGYNGSLLKLDKTFQKEWELQLGDTGAYTGFYDVEVLPDGRYILCGATPTWGHDSAYQWGWILKVDTDGTLLWDRKYIPYPRFGVYGFLYDIDILPNGDLLACGELRFTHNVGITPIQQGWILRVDSNGCEVENCLVGIETPKSPKGDLNSQMHVWPNPFTSDLSIALLNEEMHEATFTITDAVGRVVYQKEESNLAKGYTKVLDLSWLARGVYFVSVTTPKSPKGDLNSQQQIAAKRVVKE